MDRQKRWQRQNVLNQEDMIAGEQGTLTVTIRKGEEEEEEDHEDTPNIVASRFPETVVETWWIVLGSVESNEL